jgi:hypothetical protein
VARVSDIFGSQHRRPVRGTVKVHHWKGATHEEDHCPGDTGLCGCRWRCDHGSPTLGYDGVRQPQLLSNYADRPFLGALLKNRARSPRKIKRDHRGSLRSAINKVSLGLPDTPFPM